MGSLLRDPGRALWNGVLLKGSKGWFYRMGSC